MTSFRVDTYGMSSDMHWVNIPPEVPKRSPKGSRYIAVLLVLAMAFGAGVIGGIVGSGASDSVSGNGSLVTAKPVDPKDVGDTNVARAAAVIAPSVVTINSSGGSGGSVGTGIIVSSDGEVLTNYHVIEDATEVRVRLRGETNALKATVLASDPGNDLALLKLSGVKDLTAAVFADSESLAVGDQVVAVGYALALDGGPSVTAGIISAINRSFQIDGIWLNALIQTDAAISSGNSGGPLINLKGEVVGVNTAVATGGMSSAANNVGFAISVAEVQRVSVILRSMAKGEKREQGYLGISLTDRQDGGSGAVVAEVQSDSPAGNAGLKVKDLVLAINDQPITGQDALIAIVRDSAPGDKIEIAVERDGERKVFTATLIARPTQ
jgi:putative serine protease PepD